METTDLAMVSRIRVEVRGGSMEAAERAAFLLLDHARMAGFMEGVVPESGEYTDHFFNYPQVTGKPADAPDPWTELGMRYAGRLSFTFEPMVAFGGIKEFGYRIYADESELPEERRSAGHGEEVTPQVMVLQRQRLVTREHTWEGTSNQPSEVSEEATTDEVLDNIRRLVSVSALNIGNGKAPHEAWIVAVLKTDDRYEYGHGATLREAALDAYGKCGQEVAHYATTEPRGEEPDA